LPIELLDQILSYLSPLDFVNVSETCHRLRRQALDDTFWQRFVQRNVATKLKTSGIDPSFHKLYTRHHGRWFLPLHRIWYSDQYPYGKLLYARYDPYRSCIEAYQVVAERGRLNSSSVDFAGRQVEYHPFHPYVHLDLNSASIHLSGDTNEQPPDFNDEIRMPPTLQDDDSSRVEHSFIHTRNLETHNEGWQSVWPPRLLPTPDDQRVRNQSPSGFRSFDHNPSLASQLSTATFRIRQWIEFSHFIPAGLHIFGSGGQGGKRVGETVATYATLPVECYTPTKEKPWQGIWCGDYTGHGTEYLVLLQPDDPKPLPEKAQRAFAMWPNVNENAVLDDEDDEADDAGLPLDFVHHWELNNAAEQQASQTSSSSSSTTSTPAASTSEASTSNPEANTIPTRSRPSTTTTPPQSDPNDTAPYKGRLEAIKLTGDPNIPRGEPTWFVQDLGSRGFVGYTKDPVFSANHTQNTANNKDDNDDNTRGEEGEEEEEPKRIVRSVGHVAHTGFIGDGYLPNCLVLISGDRLAQYWETFGFMSFYQRVDLDGFMSV